MKKLLVAAIGAVAAYGASAGSISEQQFENVQGDLPLSMTISDLNTLAEAQTQAGFWSGDEITNKYTAVTASGFPSEKPLSTPTKALKVETKFGNPLSLSAIDGGTATNIPASGIYFDSLVKFTVCDGDGMPELNYDNAKIVMWLQENEELHKTNIMVRAGYINSDYTCTTNDYVCYTFTGDIEQYHRVTIKTWASIFEGRTVPGFAIFLDNVKVNIANGKSMADGVVSSLTEAAGYLGASSVFPSLVQGNAVGVSEISTVAFDGTGYITDLVFTDEAPFTAAEDYVAPKASVNGHDYPTLEAAVAAVNEISSSGDVTFALKKDMTLSGTLAFRSVANVNVIFDFAGFVLTNNGTTPAISNNGTLVITNSTVDVGGIVCTSTGAAVVSGAEAGQTDIMAGFFDGTITDEGWGVLRVFGGSFKDKTAALASGKVYKRYANAMGLYDVVNDSWAARLGDEVDDAFQIGSVDDLIALKNGVAASLATAGVTFKQTANIDMSTAGAFAGISDFAGTYDGGNYTISNITFTAKTYSGLFNKVTGATVKNLKIDTVSFGSPSAGLEFGGSAFVGKVYGTTTLSNLTAKGTIAYGTPCTHTVAGIATRIYGTATFVDCVNEASIYGEVRKIAGIVGIAQDSGSSASFIRCANSGTIVTTTVQHYDIGDKKNYTTGADGLAGIIAYANLTVSLKDCVNTGTIQINPENTGAAVGQLIGKIGSSASAITDLGGNSGAADKKLVAYIDNAALDNITGFQYATVNDGVATTVTTLAKDTTYLLVRNVAASETPVFTLAADGDTIAFNTALGYTFAGTVAAAGELEVTSNTVDTVTTYTAAEGSSWPQPSEDTPAAVDTALEADGFSTGTGVVTNKVEYDALIAYVAEKTSATSPEGLTAAQKANAVLCYALNAASIPATEITKEDITIDALATGDNGAVDLTVAIDGVTVGSSVPAATLAKIVTAKGGTALNAMSTKNVTVNGHVVQTGKVKITVTPNADSPTSFFTTVIINK